MHAGTLANGGSQATGPEVPKDGLHDMDIGTCTSIC